jgi:retron-type reverse transcriptase
MKRHNNLFDKIVDKDNLLLAYKKAKKHKSWQQKVIRVEKDLDNLIEELRLSLINGTYKTAEYRTKKIYEPKERTIYVLPFYPDRIVHHAIMNILEPIWDNLFISDSYACRNGKGQHIGNYLSQWFGNLYLNELDMFMKHDNKIKCYIRYCDDFLLFSNDKALLKEMAIKIKDYVENILKLRLSKCNLFPTSQGIDFLGYRHFSSGYILVRKTTAKRMKKRIRRLKWELTKKKITNDRALSVIGSISGWLKWANTYNLQISLQLNELKESIGGSVNEQI